MIKRALAALLFMTAASAFAADNKFIEDTSAQPKYKITHDQNYIYVKRPKTLVFDDSQQEALGNIDQLIHAQLNKFQAQKNSDPDGDAAALDASLTVFQKQVDGLVRMASGMYNEVKHKGLMKVDPTGFIIFAGMEYDASLLKFVSGGGSFMVGIVVVPMEVRKYSLQTRNLVSTETKWDSAWIGIPTVNVGPGVMAAAGSNPRAGIGLIWGGLNSAAEVQGLTVGPSLTTELWSGINVKLLELKNFHKPGAINNTIIMAGVEPTNVSALNGFKVFNWKAELHMNLSGIVDLNTIVAPIGRYLGPVE